MVSRVKLYDKITSVLLCICLLHDNIVNHSHHSNLHNFDYNPPNTDVPNTPSNSGSVCPRTTCTEMSNVPTRGNLGSIHYLT